LAILYFIYFAYIKFHIAELASNVLNRTRFVE
jgi:hypothetical protein